MIALNKKQLQILSILYELFMFVFTSVCIVFIGNLMHKAIIALLALVAFIGARQLTPEPYHCASLLSCFVVSTLTFACVICLSPNLSFSLVSGPILATALAYCSSYVVKYKQYKQFYEANTAFNIDNPTEAELRHRCALRKFTSTETDICVKLFCKQGTRKLSAKEYMSLVGASDEWTARNIKSAYRKRLV